MQMRRTDLALEARELWQERAGQTTRLPGVEAHDGIRDGIPVTTVRVLDDQGERELGKPRGCYVTLTLEGLEHREEDIFGRSVQAVAGELFELMKEIPPQALVLVAGLGNRSITPDAVGPLAVEHTMVTRHLVEKLPEHFGSFRPVSALAAGVLGTTGVESGELAAAMAGAVKPARVVAVDALTSRSLSRLCRTVQIADTGIVPGSGVGNARAALNEETLGVPVIAVGVPTVVDAATLCADVLAEAGRPGLDPGALGDSGKGVIVTPREIDSQVADISKVIGYGLSLALQEGLTVADVDMFLS